MTGESGRIHELYHRRPRSLFLRLNLAGALLLIIAAWRQLAIPWTDLFSPTRAANLKRFLGEVYPFALRGKTSEPAPLWNWLWNIQTERGFDAMASTFSISVVAIILAGFSALFFVFPASRNIATVEPFLPSGGAAPKWKRWWWASVVGTARTMFVIARSIPEYVLAFLFIALLGPSAWPAILALAVHNLGILGKLGAEVVENVDASSLRALRAAGLSRSQIALIGVVPASLSRWLLFFFYRWETCIREATVLGMLGVSSLGFWVRESRARDRYDEMLLFILMGSVLVLLVDLASALTRRYLRSA